MPEGGADVDQESDPGTATGPAADEPSNTIRIGRGLMALAGILVAYYAVPVSRMPTSWDLVLSCLGIALGLGVLVFIAVRQVRQLAAFQAGDAGVRLDVLALVVFVIVPLFALGYYALESGDSGQFTDLETKTDALYFSLSTLATVGFGDVHAAGQLARGLVSVQIVFDLVFVAALVSVLTTQLRARAEERRTAGSARTVAEDLDER